MASLFESDGYMVRQKVVKILGEEFHIYSDESMQNMIGYSKMAALKLKEDIRSYSDESKSKEPIDNQAEGNLRFHWGLQYSRWTDRGITGNIKAKGHEIHSKRLLGAH